MKDPCPSSREWLQLLEGETTANRELVLREHLGSCAACSADLKRCEAIVQGVAAPLPGEAPAVNASVAAVMTRVDRLGAPAQLAGAGGGRRYAPLLAASLALAAALVLVLRPAPRDGGSGMQARGTAPTLEHEVGTRFLALETPPRPLQNGAAVSAATAYVLSYRNLEQREPLYLLAFAVDSKQEVHWLYPAYDHPGEDPGAVKLAPSNSEHLMSQSVVLEGPAQGTLRLVSLVSTQPMRVSSVEQLKGAQLGLAELKARWPQAIISEVQVRLGAPQ